jgi:uncharacterized membrane protein YgcG
MKKIIIAFFSIFFLAAAAPALADDFLSFDQKIEIGANSVLTIEEKISVNFTEPRHGIYRDIPTRYKTAAGNPFNLRVTVKKVVDVSGNPVPYAILGSGNDLRIKIGDPDRLIDGKNEYTLTYEAARALLFLDDHDELYWNVIVRPWENFGYPSKISATVKLPGQLSSKSINTRCLTTLGSADGAVCFKKASNDGASFNAENTPLTIVVGWPKGAVAAPSFFANVKYFLADNWLVFLPLVVLILMFMHWWRHGRDPKISRAIVVAYDPPDKISAAEAGVVLSQSADNKAFSSIIVALCVKGYLEIFEEDGGKTYAFVLKKDWRETGLEKYEEKILAGIFGAGPLGTRVELNDIQKNFYKISIDVKNSVSAAVLERGWFVKNPAAVRAGWIGFAASYLFIGFFIFTAIGSGRIGPAFYVAFIVSGLVIGFFGFYMPAKTPAGALMFARVLGFKEFLDKAEKYRAVWLEKINVFESFLPYAIVFGVAEKWAKVFEGMNIAPPAWYHGASLHAWSAVNFAHSLENASRSISNSLATAPSAKGGGGMGGGGFGGGGFGGGGGGSW